MHDHGGGNNKSMLWMMLPCLLLLGFLFFGGSKLFSGGYLLWIIVGICVVPHIWMMFKGHGGHEGHSDTDMGDKTNNTSAKQSETKDGNDKHKGGGCCH